MSDFKSIVKKIIPPQILHWRAHKIAERMQREYGQKTVAETFSDIYEKNVWGGKSGEFYSGDGSTGEFADKYVDVIKKFIAENNIRRVVDLGCGDFQVGSKIAGKDIEYVGCDVVPSLIEHLNDKYSGGNIEFRRVNIVEDELPEGDVCLIRQVLQHLSNAEIAKVLANVRKYKFLIVTEHFPDSRKSLIPNLDIPHGPDVRLRYNSAVVLDKPPFNLQNMKLLLEVEAEDKTRLKTFVFNKN